MDKFHKHNLRKTNHLDKAGSFVEARSMDVTFRERWGEVTGKDHEWDFCGVTCSMFYLVVHLPVVFTL